MKSQNSKVTKQCITCLKTAPLTVTATPSAPYDIALLNCDGQSMVLNWKRPSHSGGAKVAEYYIDKRKIGTSVWKEVNIPPIKQRLHKVHPHPSTTITYS